MVDATTTGQEKRTNGFEPGDGETTQCKKVYISYSRTTREVVRSLAQDLLEAGVDVWVDYLSVQPGTDWRIECQKGISEADVFLPCLSPGVLDSDFVRQEIAWAKEQGKLIVPLIAESCDGLVKDDEELRWLANINWLFINNDSNYENSVLQLCHMLDASLPKADRIFISYRRDDSADIAGRIHDRLVAHFGADDIFFDVEGIPLGADFRIYLQRTLRKCVAMLVLIGPQWVNISYDSGGRRLDNPNDILRYEVESALRRDIRIIPLTVYGASPPREAELPEGMAAIVYRNGMAVRPDPDFESDMTRLIDGLEHIRAESDEW